ncbi:hypothetical protein B9479_002109 [Cryptococcus floricola]|uniref:Major facilitator superfamily (MFS) profile domain-containing protein n=1 Tax=Cryptococcus floricola TaxID=2591691 RepID=A0A5D3B340_9TREE|nr:hypothetical protein B9479_002109 [Cryptococcus floricola]
MSGEDDQKTHSAALSETILPAVYSTGSPSISSAVATLPQEKGEELDDIGIIAHSHEQQQLTLGKKKIVLVLFCLVQFFDGAGKSGIYPLTTPISDDLSIKYQDSTWILNAYSLTFATFLPLSGLCADLFSARPIYTFGVALSGLTNLATSFLPDQYAFFVIRAVSGIAAAMTVPSASRLTSHMYQGDSEEDKHRRKMGLMLLGMVGGLSNSVGIILGGAFGAIPLSGQLAGWRWFFRFTAAILLPLGRKSAITHKLSPNTQGTLYNTPSSSDTATLEKESAPMSRLSHIVRKLDLPAVVMLLVSILLLTLSLTLASSNTTLMSSSKAYSSPEFLVTFLLSWPLLIAFFLWESRREKGMAMIPSSIWKTGNVSLVAFVALEPLAYWIIVQLPYIERWESVNHDSTMTAALRALPSGIAAFMPAFILPKLLPRINLRFLLIAGLTGTIVALALFTASEGRIGKCYFAFVMPAFMIGSFSNSCAVTSVNLLVIMSVPHQMAGTASAIVQVALQIGCAIAIAIQASFLTIHPGGLADFRNLQISYYFQMGWIVLCIAMLVVIL